MAVPTSITDCNATAANNSPAGSDSIGTSLDDYLRAHAAIIRQVSDDTLHLAGGTVTGQIKGITPVAAADLTRKDYVDTMLPKAGGTVTGTITTTHQIKGITPVAAEDLTRKDYVDGTNDLSPNGYQKLPGGLIIQWGNGTAVGGGIAQASFPIPFPNNCLQITANSTSSNIIMAVAAFDANGYTIYANLGTTGAGTDTSFRYIAIGY